jgi:hypothetical protein
MAGAGLPKPIVSASSTLRSFRKEAPASVDDHKPYAPSAEPPASQIRPSRLVSALNRTDPSGGSPTAGVAVNVKPASSLR